MDAFSHIRSFLGIIVGLATAQLLGGMARIVQHPKKFKIHWIHLMWTLFLFLFLLHFWWWEFNLQRIIAFTFPVYVFVAVFAVLLYFLCSLFYPTEMNEYNSYRDYFYSRQRWIYSMMALVFLADIGDTAIKGSAYWHRLGPMYDIRVASFLLFAIAAIWIKRPWFHAFFAIFATLYEIAYILHLNFRIG